MSSYGHFILEVRTKDGWKHITWKSNKSLNSYLSEADKVEGDDMIHQYVTIAPMYSMRDYLTQGDFGHSCMCEDFTEETETEINLFKDDYGWYEGYFYLNELNTFILNKKEELKRFESNNLQQAIYDEVRKISSKLDNIEFTKSDNEINPFDEYYEDEKKDLQSDIDSMESISTILYYVANEICGYIETNDIRVIIVAG